MTSPFSNSSSAAEARLSNTDLTGSSGVLGNLAGKVSNIAVDKFWDFAAIDETHWNKSYPYQLVLLKKEGNSYEMKDKFTLPINPTELSISSPFAITTSVTLGGIVEEHNGSPIKMISIQGSTGFLPTKGSPAVSQSIANAIFGGVLSGVSAVQAGARQVVSGGSSAVAPNLIQDTSFNSKSDLQGGTGYFQFTLLRNFLEAYVALKKTTAGAPYRLALVIWKDTEAWLVTPVSFDLKRSASSALEYMYTIQLKAWKRYSPAKPANAKAFQNPPMMRSPNVMAKALNSFRGARNILLGAKAVLTGFRADVDAALFLPLRETGMFIKTAIGVGLTAHDLPAEILRDAKSSIIELLSSPGGLQRLQSLNANLEDVKALIRDLGVITGIAETQADPVSSRRDQAADRKTLQDAAASTAAAASGAAAVAGANAASVRIAEQAAQRAATAAKNAKSSQTLGTLGANAAHPANKVFDHPEKYHSLFDAIQLGSLNTKPATAKKIVQEKERVQKKTRLDFETHRDVAIQLAADYADFVGAGASTFSTTYNRNQPVATRDPTDDDWDVLFALNQVAMEYNRLAASTSTDTRNKLTAMEYLAGQAQRSGIPFKVPLSAYAVPFPYGSTLEVISNRYLGTPDRWHEIAVLNNLRPPYVDEEGFSMPLTVNGSANTIQVEDGANLYMGQPVWLTSTTVPREKRRITQLRRLSSTVWIVGLDGVGDLSKFTTATDAELFAFTPGTVNSLQVLYIPSDQPPAEPDFEPKGNETLDEFETYLQVGGVDLLLTSRGDLAIGLDGDCRLSIGLANIVQHVGLVLNIEPGTLMRHPDVGFAVRPGTSTGDVSAQDILLAAKQSFANDRTFTGIGAASILKNGPSMAVSLSLGVAGVSHFIPVSFTVRT